MAASNLFYLPVFFKKRDSILAKKKILYVNILNLAYLLIIYMFQMKEIMICNIITINIILIYSQNVGRMVYAYKRILWTIFSSVCLSRDHLDLLYFMRIMCGCCESTDSMQLIMCMLTFFKQDVAEDEKELEEVDMVCMCVMFPILTTFSAQVARR